MTEPRFLQIHSLHSYPAALLNRDDSGLAKRLPFGGATRTRISSQCLKRHWRVADDEYALERIGVPMATRSRLIVQREIHDKLLAEGIESETAEAVAEVFLKSLFQEGKKRKAAKKQAAEEAETGAETAAEADFGTGQAVLLGHEEIRYLRSAALEAARAGDDKAAKAAAEAFFKDKAIRQNIAAMKHHAGLEAALFGRMVTSDLLANTDAAIHVAHAFTVHAEESESDYFTVVDDLHNREAGDDAGAAGIFDVELTSGLYYGYVVVDVPLLVANLEGIARDRWLAEGTDRSLAGRVVEHLLHLIAKVSPGAKLGSTAPYGYAHLTLVEAGNRQPRSLANAFRDPLRLNRDGGSLQAVARIAQHLQDHDRCYGPHEARRLAALEDSDLPAAESVSFPDLAAWTAEAVRSGRA